MKYNFVFTFISGHMIRYGRQAISVEGNITTKLLSDIERYIENHNADIYHPVIISWQKLEEE